MNALQRREVLMKVRKEMKCPLCSTTIPASNISLAEDFSNDFCTVEMKCKSCSSTFGGQAFFHEQVTELGKKLNASSRLPVTKKRNDEIFSQQESSQIKESLKYVTNLSDVFKKK